MWPFTRKKKPEPVRRAAVPLSPSRRDDSDSLLNISNPLSPLNPVSPVSIWNSDSSGPSHSSLDSCHNTYSSDYGSSSSYDSGGGDSGGGSCGGGD